MLVDALWTSGGRAKDLGSRVTDNVCGRAVLFTLFNLRKFRLAFLWSTKHWKPDLIQIVLCLKGKWQNRCADASDCIWLYALDTEEEILFIFVFVKERFIDMWNRKFCSLTCCFLCVCSCVLGERRILGEYTIWRGEYT